MTTCHIWHNENKEIRKYLVKHRTKINIWFLCVYCLKFIVSLKISTINYYLVIDYHIMPGRKIPRRWRKPDETQLQDKLSRILSQKR